jgi:hypothetical protein
MSADKVMNLDLNWIDAKLQNNGSVTLEIGAHTPGGKLVKVNLNMHPCTVGTIGAGLHAVVREQERRLMNVKRELRGEG